MKEKKKYNVCINIFFKLIYSDFGVGERLNLLSVKDPRNLNSSRAIIFKQIFIRSKSLLYFSLQIETFYNNNNKAVVLSYFSFFLLSKYLHLDPHIISLL